VDLEFKCRGVEIQWEGLEFGSGSL